MKSTWRNVVLLFLSLNITLATSSHLRLPQHAMGTLLTLNNHALRHLHQRQSQSASALDSNSWYTMTTAEAGDSNCLFALLGVDGSVPYPVKFESCNPLQDDALWQFVPDSEGRYYIYNKGWAGTEQRLDINCQTPSLCIEWMGPSGDIYNNQRWFLVSYSAKWELSYVADLLLGAKRCHFSDKQPRVTRQCSDLYTAWQRLCQFNAEHNNYDY